MDDAVLGGSFRDPSGFLFERDGVLYRRVQKSYASHYDRLMDSGLYARLVEQTLLVPHDEVPDSRAPGAHRTLRPERIPFVSYPYEWSFSQLRDAALTTLRVQRLALASGMTLKDASAYNIQFQRGAPIFIDTLSFETYEEGVPWVGYRQFCQHFLAPLALMAHRDVRLGQLLRMHLDGIPLDLARALLPARAWLDVQLFLHIRLHAGYQRRHQGVTQPVRPRPVSKKALGNLITALESAVRKLRWNADGTTWSDYYEGNSYTDPGGAAKRELVAQYLERCRPASVWDLGANTGVFSRLATERGIPTVAFDFDPACVDRNYRQAREVGDANLLPLLLDLANPSPGLGWSHEERTSFVERGPAGLVMALALVHHLAIANNVPLPRIASLLARLGEWLVIEFVPKSDSKVQQLLANRVDVFPGYTQTGFEEALSAEFEINDRSPIADSERVLYLMRRSDARPATSPT